MSPINERLQRNPSRLGEANIAICDMGYDHERTPAGWTIRGEYLPRGKEVEVIVAAVKALHDQGRFDWINAGDERHQNSSTR